MSDAEQKTLIIPKVRAVASSETFEKPASATDGGYSRRGGGSGGWAKGTGYGSGTQSDWDVDAFLAAQKKKDSEILEICTEMLHELQADRVPEGLAEVLAQSCLIPFLQSYLENDSITDMERHVELYHTVYAVSCHMARHQSLARLFNLLPGETKSLSSIIREREKQALIVERFSSSTATTGSTTAAKRAAPKVEGRGTRLDLTVNITSRILELCSLMETGLKRLADEEAKAAAERARTEVKVEAKVETKTTTATGPEETKVAAVPEKKARTDASSSTATATTTPAGETKTELSRYIEILSQWKFDELASFRAHHYLTSSSAATGGTSREWVRRLANEYSDLSKSLPIFPDSSVFMRVHASKMAYAQMLIIAADNTPYGRGAFLFDLNFPSTYPNTPPLVNLQTTGGGSIRFNPNLYNCGKVCLSLLGTWRGSGVSENWNPKTSTFLQVAVSIQSLIFVPEPYFNEPGYESEMGTSTGRTRSDEYNRNIQQGTVKFAMIDIMKNPPPGFEKIIAAHFFLQKHNILRLVEEWASTNSAVRTLIPSLRAELDKQRMPTTA